MHIFLCVYHPTMKDINALHTGTLAHLQHSLHVHNHQIIITITVIWLLTMKYIMMPTNILTLLSLYIIISISSIHAADKVPEAHLLQLTIQ